MPRGTLGKLDYDRLVLAAGSGVWRPASVVGIDAAFDVDQLEDALRLEAHLHALRDLPDSPARNTVVVAGGGFTGIETATEMPARLWAILGEKAALRVIVVDHAAPPSAHRWARPEWLDRRGLGGTGRGVVPGAFGGGGGCRGRDARRRRGSRRRPWSGP